MFVKNVTTTNTIINIKMFRNYLIFQYQKKSRFINSTLYAVPNACRLHFIGRIILSRYYFSLTYERAFQNGVPLNKFHFQSLKKNQNVYKK